MASLRIIAITSILGSPAKQPDRPCRPWPRFTILVPLYQEAQMVSSLIANLSKLDYPKDRLDIVLVTEADDIDTCTALHAYMKPPFRMFAVEPSLPRTKPKALNAALASIPKRLKGDIITVYDAEDRPHPLQLKSAARALEHNSGLAAVQAPLGYYNDRDNLLTSLFALEYAALFHIWNPALARFGLPFTLGGTSNHIRRAALEAAGGWDSYNVTEDADLSFRISALSRKNQPMKIGCIPYGTEEEAVSSHKQWVGQRSRWLKGFMQTGAVHMRPKRCAPDGGHFALTARIKNALTLQITVGATLMTAFLHLPSILIITILLLADALLWVQFTLPSSFFILLAIGYGAAILMGIAGALKAGKPWLAFYAPLMPLYWLFYFRAALIAAWEFIVAPDFWRKTHHKGQKNEPPNVSKPNGLEGTSDFPI